VSVITLDPEVAGKATQLEAVLRSLGRVVVACSGGVDSALLAVAAHRSLGDAAVAVTTVSPSMASGDLDLAAAVCRQFGIGHHVLHTREVEDPNYARNPPDRCYFCKLQLVGAMEQLAHRLGIPHVIHGQNADDSRDLRPGAQAARERGVRAPLAEVGMTKAEIRQLARAWGIGVWDRPSAACLSSRIPYGTPVTAAALAMIDRVERHLRVTCGYPQVRSRHHGDTARIELPAEALGALLADTPRREALTAEYAAAGYARVTVDLRGFRSGSMNEALSAVEPPAGDAASRMVQEFAEIGAGSAHCEPRGEMLYVQVPGGAFQYVTCSQLRDRLVRRAEERGFHYLALDLTPLPG
jgi:pyridinium-3,5-biscarboxylic acid mononucleotide sulfurtransferase